VTVPSCLPGLVSEWGQIDVLEARDLFLRVIAQREDNFLMDTPAISCGDLSERVVHGDREPERPDM